MHWSDVGVVGELRAVCLVPSSHNFFPHRSMMSCDKDSTFCCPGEYDRCNSSDYSHPIGANPYISIPAIISSTISCIGCVLIVYSYYRWKELRSTGSRTIITYLSIADFFTAFGYIIGSLNYAISYNNTECTVFTNICVIQSFVTTWSSMSSFLWTLTLAIYLYVSLVQNKMSLIRRFFPAFHVVNWGFPIFICIPLLATKKMGFTFYAASTWCYVKADILDPKSISLIFIAGKFWEILTYILVILLYILIKRHVTSQSKKALTDNSLNAGLLAILRRSDKKLIAVPILFVLLRCWGTIHFFFSMIVDRYVHNGCTSAVLAYIFMVLGVMQAVGDGGQGWGNFILYVVVSSRVRNKLFSCCVSDSEPLLEHLKDKSSTINGSSSAVRYDGIQNSQEREIAFEPTTT